MLFRQLFLTAIRSMTVKKLFGSSCGLNSDIFSTARAEGLVSQVAHGAATHILYRRMYVVNRGIVRSVSQQQVHKCGRILSGEKNHLSREKYLASHRVTPMCAILKQFWLQHIFLLFPIPHSWSSDFSSCIATPQV